MTGLYFYIDILSCDSYIAVVYWSIWKCAQGLRVPRCGAKIAYSIRVYGGQDPNRPTVTLTGLCTSWNPCKCPQYTAFWVSYFYNLM